MPERKQMQTLMQMPLKLKANRILPVEADSKPCQQK